MTTKDRQTQTNINRLTGQLTLKHTVNNNTVYFQESDESNHVQSFVSTC